MTAKQMGVSPSPRQQVITTLGAVMRVVARHPDLRALTASTVGGSSHLHTTPRTGCAGHAGGAVTCTGPEPAITSGKQPVTRGTE
jgi:hypothetical protein